MKSLLMLAAAAAILLAGCSEPTDNNEFSDQLVVNAFLIGGQPIDSVFIRHTGRVTELYTNETSAVTNAVVVITGNNVSDTLVHDPAHRGRYMSRNRSSVVRPGASYSLSVRVPGYGAVSGTTIVPDTFSVTNSGAFPSTVSYKPSSAPLAIGWSDSRNFADYLVVVRSTDPRGGLIPKSFTNDQAPERTQIGFFLQDAHTCDISWLYFSYYGPTDISVAAIDQNYFDYLKQAMAAQGASDIRELRYNLIGAIGVFGSETVAKNGVTVTVTP